MAAPRRPSGGGLRRAPQDGRLEEINKVGLGPPPDPTPAGSGEGAVEGAGGARARGGRGRWVQAELPTPLPKPLWRGDPAAGGNGVSYGHRSPSPPLLVLPSQAALCSPCIAHRWVRAGWWVPGGWLLCSSLWERAPAPGGYCSPGALQPPLCCIKCFNFFFPE